MREVIPYERAFDKIAMCHMKSGHGDFTRTMEVINRKYFISSICVEVFLRLCPICCKNKKRQFNKATAVSILTLPKTSDGYEYILVYEDPNTKFLQLRPLKTAKNHEISAELLKIFTDFGIPQKLLVTDLVFFSSVNIMVNKLAPFCNVAMVEAAIGDGTTRVVNQMMTDWIKNNNCNDWVMACYIVQWHYNNLEFDGVTPFNSVFCQSALGNTTSSDKIVDINLTAKNSRAQANITTNTEHDTHSIDIQNMNIDNELEQPDNDPFADIFQDHKTDNLSENITDSESSNEIHIEVAEDLLKDDQFMNIKEDPGSSFANIKEDYDLTVKTEHTDVDVVNVREYTQQKNHYVNDQCNVENINQSPSDPLINYIRLEEPEKSMINDDYEKNSSSKMILEEDED